MDGFTLVFELTMNGCIMHAYIEVMNEWRAWTSWQFLGKWSRCKGSGT
jgi:hypothetical protein